MTTLEIVLVFMGLCTGLGVNCVAVTSGYSEPTSFGMAVIGFLLWPMVLMVMCVSGIATVRGAR